MWEGGSRVLMHPMGAFPSVGGGQGMLLHSFTLCMGQRSPFHPVHGANETFSPCT